MACLAILKENDVEQKLCCLRVMDSFHSSGLGIRLFEKSFELLNNPKPLLSITDVRMPEFARVCDYFGFQLEQTLSGFYKQNHTEYVFNGILSNESSYSYEVIGSAINRTKISEFCPPSA